MCFVLDMPKMTYFKSKYVAYLEEYAILSNKTVVFTVILVLFIYIIDTTGCCV